MYLDLLDHAAGAGPRPAPRREYRDGIELLPVTDALADPASMLTAPNETA